ncbi:hypothetical protein K523DRAFT_324253 [Schizophyllum commune Tattone D]|nr:hypothetical protein K523DRAFT_324253 [Schizophyllum commune Tattone D]
MQNKQAPYYAPAKDGQPAEDNASHSPLSLSLSPQPTRSSPCSGGNRCLPVL